MFFKTPKNIDFAGYADDNTPYKCSIKYGRSVRKPSRGIRATLPMILCKSLGRKRKKV